MVEIVSYVATILAAGTVAFAVTISNAQTIIFSISTFGVIFAILFQRLVEKMQHNKLLIIGTLIAALISSVGSMFLINGLTTLTLLKIFVGVSYILTSAYLLKTALFGRYE